MNTVTNAGSTAVDELHHPEVNRSFLELFVVLMRSWRLLAATPVAAAAATFAITLFLISPTYTASTSFLPPQQQQSAAASALASLGALSGLAGAGSMKNIGDQYVSLMQSVTVADRVIEKLGLMTIYGDKFKAEARRHLSQRVQINYGKRDGIITVDADANSPELAAKIANTFVEELRRLSSELAITEAQQRRVFFETQLGKTRIALADAQAALQASGFNANAIKAEPRAAAEAYGTLKAEITAAEVKLQTLRRTLADATPEVQRQLALVAALQAQIHKAEQSSQSEGADYIGKYREYKYQETLLELFARQFELAKLDESREGSGIQIIDPATPPELKSKPKRALLSLAVALIALLLTIAMVLANQLWRDAKARPDFARRLSNIRHGAR